MSEGVAPLGNFELIGEQEGYRANWCHVQLQSHLWKLGLPLLERVLHSDAQGEYIANRLQKHLTNYS